MEMGDIKNKIIVLLGVGITAVTMAIVFVVSYSLKAEKNPDYSNHANWAYFAVGEGMQADLFLIAPTVDTRSENNMSLTDTATMQNFVGALNMQRGIYENCTRMYAPFYRQASTQVYSLPVEDREEYLEFAYQDVSSAFSWYLEHENNGRPIVLAGFSQGADMCYRLLKEYFGDEDLRSRLVAVYAIGWPYTEADVAEFPQMVPASGETDTGVIISFDCEDENVINTFIYPESIRALSINPLNWTTDTTPASKDLNLGACFLDRSGNITSEIPAFCGCHIDEKRGTLKLSNVKPAEYPSLITGLPSGAYHIYDYKFFYSNLQDNVEKRVNAYTNAA